MTRNGIARLAAGCVALAAAAGCLRGPIDRAHAGDAAGSARAPVWVASAPPAAAADVEAELRDLQRRLSQAQSERDAAVYQLRQAQASNRELEARLSAIAAPVRRAAPAPARTPGRHDSQVFKSLTTAPTP